MQIILAKHAGFCFGVKRAVQRALELAAEGRELVSLGDLIHNQKFVEYLRQKGIRSVQSVQEVPEGARVLIRSHGVPPERYEQLRARGLETIDLTCPFVARIHKKARQEQQNYAAILIVGKAEHPEVVGIKGWAGERARVVGSVQEARALPAFESALVVAQTTITHELLEQVYAVIREKTPGAVLFDSICETTLERQKETGCLAKNSDAVVVIGDRHSSNTRKLFEIAQKYCKNTFYVESAGEIALENFRNCDIISLVAGASAPDWIIEEVRTQMSELEKAQATEEVVAAEEVEVASQDVAAEQVEPAAEENVAEQAQVEEDENDFASQLEKTFVKVRRGQFVKGTVVQVTDDEICVNIGYKSDGLIKKEDLALEGDVSLTEAYKPGDEIEAEIVTLNDGEGNVRLSRRKIESQLKWKELIENLDEEKFYDVTVSKVIKGGVLTKLEGYDAFIPASQLSLKYVEDLTIFVGQTLPVKIIDIDKRQKRFVLSNKAALQKQLEEHERAIFESFEKGSAVRGVVKRLTDFGAFVDVGGVDGLLHVTDISWVRIKHPKDVLKEGQEIDVKILNVDPEKKKISLGYKQLQPKPWDLVPEKYNVGDIIEGKVVRIAPFGAFVELEPTVDGLIHISQVTNRRIEKVEDVLALGQTVKAKVLEVNAEKRRISLSMRALIETPKQNDEGDEDEKSAKPARRAREEAYTLPPVEEATTSLADLFKQAEEE